MVPFDLAEVGRVNLSTKPSFKTSPVQVRTNGASPSIYGAFGNLRDSFNSWVGARTLMTGLNGFINKCIKYYGVILIQRISTVYYYLRFINTPFLVTNNNSNRGCIHTFD